MTAAEQLRDEVAAQATSWGALLGLDVMQLVLARIEQRTPMILAQLGSAERAGTAADLLDVLHPDEVPPGWWRTDLGRLVAAAGGMGDGEVSQAEAARLLGVARSRVHALIGEGKLEAASSGGVMLASIGARLQGRTQ